MKINDNKYLCKAKRKDNNEWTKGYLVKYSGNYYIYYEYPDERYETGYYLSYKEVIPETIMLSTTTVDDNGTLIFEGDVVTAYKHNETKITQAIIFRDGCFWFGNWNWIEFLSIFRNIKIINNIHNEDEKEPECYISNNEPYPLCKGNKENKCHHCCLFEDYTDYNQPHPEEIIYEVHVEEENNK